jgi:hypothetical protein
MDEILLFCVAVSLSKYLALKEFNLYFSSTLSEDCAIYTINALFTSYLFLTNFGWYIFSGCCLVTLGLFSIFPYGTTYPVDCQVISLKI